MSFCQLLMQSRCMALSFLAILIFVQETHQAIAVPSQCYPVCNQAMNVWISEVYPNGTTACHLFNSAMASVFACTSKWQSACYLVTSTISSLDSAINFCRRQAVARTVLVRRDCVGSNSTTASSQSFDSDSFSSYFSSCSSYSKASVTTVSSYCATYEAAMAEAFGQMPITMTQNSTTAFTTAESSPSSSTDSTIATSSPASALSGPTIGTGAIAGIAAGSAVGGIVLFAAVLYFIWRHRKQKRRKLQSQAAAVPTSDQGEAEKAQLHSDDLKPHREELYGSKIPRNIRAIAGMHEIETNELGRTWSEMAANEPAGSEMGSSPNHRSTDSSTLVSSSPRYDRL